MPDLTPWLAASLVVEGIAIGIDRHEDDIAHVRMHAQPRADTLFCARKHIGQEAVFARNHTQRTRFVGGEQPLRLPHRNPRTEEDRNAARPEERRLLPRRIIEASDDGLRRLFRLIVQLLEGRRGSGLGAPGQSTGRGSQPPEDITQTR